MYICKPSVGKKLIPVYIVYLAYQYSSNASLRLINF